METSPDDEINVMQEIYSLLKKIDPDAQRRVLKYISDRVGIVPAPPIHQKKDETQKSDENHKDNEISIEDFDSASELISKIEASTEADKALSVAVFLHKNKNMTELTGQQINKELFNMGHKATNITRAITSLMESKPQLMVQLKKRGTSKQGRKDYKVTTAGYNYIQQKLNATPNREAESIDA